MEQFEAFIACSSSFSNIKQSYYWFFCIETKSAEPDLHAIDPVRVAFSPRGSKTYGFIQISHKTRQQRLVRLYGGQWQPAQVKLIEIESWFKSIPLTPHLEAPMFTRTFFVSSSRAGSRPVSSVKKKSTPIMKKSTPIPMEEGPEIWTDKEFAQMVREHYRPTESDGFAIRVFKHQSALRLQTMDPIFSKYPLL